MPHGTAGYIFGIASFNSTNNKSAICDYVYDVQLLCLCPLDLIGFIDGIQWHVTKYDKYCLNSAAVSVLQIKLISAECFVKTNVYSIQEMRDNRNCGSIFENFSHIKFHPISYLLRSCFMRTNIQTDGAILIGDPQDCEHVYKGKSAKNS
jgi:hypothetical protein